MDRPPATIYIVDDDADVCTALARLLRSMGCEPRIFATGVEFLAAHEPERFGCVILDLLMPGCGGLEIQTRLAATGSRRPVIFLTANGSIDASVRAIKAGAVNFLTKPVEAVELFAAVEEALRIDATERKQESLRLALVRRLQSLTPREREVLGRIVAGRLNKQIAADLGTVEKTIKVHRARVMRKMGARSLAELVLLAVACGITPEPPGLAPDAGQEWIAHSHLGALSAALVHELRQPLTAILSNAQAARRALAGPKPDIQEIDAALADTIAQNRRAIEVMKRLHALLVQGTLSMAPIRWPRTQAQEPAPRIRSG